MSWQGDNKWESNWWGNCVNTYWEETKQRVYAKKMGLNAFIADGKYPVYDLKGIKVLDIGGGPVSILLKCQNRYAVVSDPCPYPKWVSERYLTASINYRIEKGEEIEIPATPFDEVWIYNVLQHTDDPGQIIQNARKAGKLIRIFEWIDTPVSEGHPHSLTEAKLNEWLHGEGKVEEINESGCVGKCYYGVFPT
jgi:2-polyprenyl-3-methyl-5-hydroxy-6-metoxy-1,4-benzoquinol methylase